MTNLSTNKGRFSNDQRKEILAEAAKSPVSEVLKKHNISATTFYKWKHRMSGRVAKPTVKPQNGELQRLRAENLKLLALIGAAVVKDGTAERIILTH